MAKVKAISITEARPRLTHLVNEVAEGGEPYFIVSNSQVKAVIMGLDEYNHLMDRLEDLEDTVELLNAELENEPTIPFEDYLKERAERQKADVPAAH
ncbi:MAG: type II toxin-antitoxin system Phd/YefM family antitoxin [Chloroflexi bacterium]|nr:type II toxin-antitoxin system Phd/YefM family antitoxin [Chloroflexota bacterium]